MDNNVKLTFIDLFAGIGGIRLGFRRLEQNVNFHLNGMPMLKKHTKKILR